MSRSRILFFSPREVKRDHKGFSWPSDPPGTGRTGRVSRGDTLWKDVGEAKNQQGMLMPEGLLQRDRILPWPGEGGAGGCSTQSRKGEAYTVS